jgi:hypothetical protein
MKSLKAAAVVAVSLALAGAAAPASAHDAADLTPTSLNGAVNTLTKDPFALALRHQSPGLDTENKDSLLHIVKGATTALEGSPTKLLGGLPLQR